MNCAAIVEKWFSRKLFAGAAAAGLVYLAAYQGFITWDAAADRIRDIGIAYLTAQGAVDALGHFKKGNGNAKADPTGGAAGSPGA